MRLLLVDDHAMIREGLRAVLAREPGLEVVGEGADGREAVALAVRLAPDVVVMDISMPGLNGVEATRQIVAMRPRTRVIGLSMNADAGYVHALFEAGASAYLLKNAASDELVRALHAVAAGQKYLSSSITGVVVAGFLEGSAPRGAGAAATLSAREREVLQLLAEGKTSKEAAQRLGVAASTIETHRRQLMGKLDLHTVAELTKYAIRNGLTSLE